MLTQAQVLEAVKGGRQSGCGVIDSRDYARLVDFFPVDQWETFGFKPKEGAVIEAPKPWTREALLEQLKSDVEFGLEKAYGERGISASLMYEVVKMWMWIFEDELQNHDNYHGYGLDFFKAVATKFFPDMKL